MEILRWKKSNNLYSFQLILSVTNKVSLYEYFQFDSYWNFEQILNDLEIYNYDNLITVYIC